MTRCLYLLFPLLLLMASCGSSGHQERKEALEFFKDHKSDLDQLIAWGETAEQSPWGYPCHQPELPRELESVFDSKTALVCKNDDHIALVAIMPTNGYHYFTYIPLQQSPPTTHIGGYSVACSEKIDADWFFCKIGIN